MNRISARHVGSGVWDITCEGHDEPLTARGINSATHVVTSMQDHVDEAHPGQRFALRRESDIHPLKRGYYTGTLDSRHQRA